MVQRFSPLDNSSQQSEDPSGGASSGKNNQNPETSKKILSTGGLIMSILFSLLLGLSVVVRSLKNVSLSLNLNLKRDDRAEKKYD